jgi:hypothetical protein
MAGGRNKKKGKDIRHVQEVDTSLLSTAKSCVPTTIIPTANDVLNRLIDHESRYLQQGQRDSNAAEPTLTADKPTAAAFV